MKDLKSNIVELLNNYKKELQYHMPKSCGSCGQPGDCCDQNCVEAHLVSSELIKIDSVLEILKNDTSIRTTET